MEHHLLSAEMQVCNSKDRHCSKVQVFHEVILDSRVDRRA